MTEVNDVKREIKKGTSAVLRRYIKATRNGIQVEETSNALRKHILKIVKNAINKLYEVDIVLLKEKMYEVTICGRFAMYLQDFFKGFKGYYVDIEYYMLSVPPEEYKGGNEGRIRCDILLHSRSYYERRVDILLAMEVKLEKSLDDGKSDMSRLEDFVIPEKHDMPFEAVHSTLVGLFLRLGENGYSSALCTSEGYTLKTKEDT